MNGIVLLFLTCSIVMVSSWSLPNYPVPRAPLAVTRFAPPPPHRVPVRITNDDQETWQRAKRDHHDHDDYHHDYDHDHGRDRHRDHGSDKGRTGPVHTFVKTDKNANYKWGVRHHVGNQFAA